MGISTQTKGNQKMHPDEFNNWAIIKTKFEENGTTDNYFYKRACAIVAGQPDPMDNLNHGASDDTTEMSIATPKQRLTD